jgi:SPP1 family predicted phage head-tail adaptor
VSNRIKAGALRHRVAFEELVADLDSDGATVENWAPSFPTPVSAEIKALSGRELIAAQAVQSKISTRIKVRYRPGFKATMRGVHRGVIYDVEAVIPDPDSGIGFLTLLCSSGVSDGQ